MDETIEKVEEEVVVEESPEETEITPESEVPSQDDNEYAAIAEAETRANNETAKRLEAEALIVKNKKLAKREEVLDEEEDEDQPVTLRSLKAILSQNNSQQQRSLSEDKIQEIASSLAKSQAEALAIIATFKNRTFPSNLSLKEQLEESQAIVNRKKTDATNQELKRALKNKTGVNTTVSGTQRDPMVGSEPKLSPADKKGITDAGYSYDSALRVWKKPLGKGKHLFMKDLKSPTWIA